MAKTFYLNIVMKTDEEKLVRIRKIMSDFNKESRISECFYHKKSECTGTIKQAHSLQRNGKLSLIEADVNGQNVLYSAISFESSPQQFVAKLKPIGKAVASTFYGFCDHHDTSLFSPIENFAYFDSNEHNFLHSYRSFAHSWHRKNEELKLYSGNSWIGFDVIPKEYSDQMLEGVRSALQDLNPLKTQLDEFIEAKDYSALEYFVFEYQACIPLGVSSIISVFSTFKNQTIIDILNYRTEENWSSLIITVFPEQDKTVCILAAFPNDTGAMLFLDELDTLSDFELGHCVTSLMLGYAENMFFSPLIWNKLTSKEQSRLILELNQSASNASQKFTKSKFNFFQTRFEKR